ncbi:MAG TPA: GerMN domain-containing protein, partial [Tissierellales bacterium]|nr:GerMN domain-containing protein [Tissierellales bacterium]
MRKFLVVFMSIILMFSLVACSSSKDSSEEKEEILNDVESSEPKYDESESASEASEEETEGESTLEILDEDTENNVVEPAPETKEKEITLYFVNKDYIDTGDESLEKLIGEKRVIKFDSTPLEEAVVKELIEGAKNPKLSTVIPSNAQLINVEVADKTAFVNFAQEGLFGGSMQEIFTLNQIIKSLLELDSVDKVQFL